MFNDYNLKLGQRTFLEKTADASGLFLMITLCISLYVYNQVIVQRKGSVHKTCKYCTGCLYSEAKIILIR